MFMDREAAARDLGTLAVPDGVAVAVAEVAADAAPAAGTMAHSFRSRLLPAMRRRNLKYVSGRIRLGLDPVRIGPTSVPAAPAQTTSRTRDNSYAT